MQFFFVKNDVLLKLPHKQKQLFGVSEEQQNKGKASTEKIYCGSIAWECLDAQKILGKDNALFLVNSAIKQELLPYQITPYANGADLVAQLKTLIAKRQKSGLPTSLRIALINGTGTMLGDTLIGSSVLEHILEYLKTQGFVIEVDVYAAWNARPGVEDLWRRNPMIRTVYDSSPTIKALQAYDAYWDYSELIIMPSFGLLHHADFFYLHFGVNPNAVSDGLKLVKYRVKKHEFENVKEYLKEKSKGLPVVFLQAQASTPARSIPDCVLVPLLKTLAREQSIKVVMTSPYPKGLTNFERAQIINASMLTENHLERYFALVTLSDYVITVDTLALHLAAGAKKPGLGLFSITDPALLLKYSPQIKGLLIPNAQKLPYWNKHKHDDQWGKHQGLYGKAWEALDLPRVIKDHVNQFVQSSKNIVMNNHSASSLSTSSVS